MRAFDVSLNGKRLCLAGVGEDGVLSAIVSWVTRGRDGDLFLQVGGLLSATDEHVAWVRQKPLGVGDKIQLRIVEKPVVDRPVKKYRFDSKEERRHQKRYVRMMAKKFGWTIGTRAKK